MMAKTTHKIVCVNAILNYFLGGSPLRQVAHPASGDDATFSKRQNARQCLAGFMSANLLSLPFPQSFPRQPLHPSANPPTQLSTVDRCRFTEMSNLATKRLQKELKDLTTHAPVGLALHQADDLQQWYLRLQGAESTLYQNQTFLLKFTFGPNYPLESPEVVFVTKDNSEKSGQTFPIPAHNHVYSNGHICLSILYDQWSPALTVSSVGLSLLSMLSSSTSLARPRDNDRYVLTAGTRSPKQTNWAFHDDTV